MTTVLPPSIVARLTTTGVTSRFVTEQTGIPYKQAVAALLALGCIKDRAARYYLRGTRSPAASSYGKARECRPSERSGVAWGTARDAV